MYSFNPQTDGGTPSGLIQATDGNFYGTTGGAAFVNGTVFKITPGGVFSILHNFNNSGGANPMAGVIQGTDGNLYGTTLQSYMTNNEFGGYGTIFRITLSGSLTTLYSFASGPGGAYPFTRLTQAGDGNFYGIAFGGSGGWGTIFKITPGGSFDVLHSFSYTDGGYAIIGGVYPHGGLVRGADGNLYATTTIGGAGLVYGVAAGGTIFRITLGGALTTVYNIRGIDGNTFHGDLIQGTVGNFYATISQSGAYNDGSVFSFAAPAAVALPTITAVVNAASFQAGPISPGEVITIGGSDLGPPTAAGLTLDQTGKVSTQVAGVQVQFGGFAAPLTYVSSTQINAVVPYEIQGLSNLSTVVTYESQTSNAFPTTATPTAPALFTSNGSGTGPVACLNQDYTYNGPVNPAPKGSYIVLYLTGEGQTAPQGVTGEVTVVSAVPPLTPQPVLPVIVLIGGQSAFVAFYGEAPGFVAGVMQVNVQIPLNVPSGNIPLSVSVGGNSSQAGVTVSVQ
jgi:uncharacterized protein (TIGR03437 family)